MSDAAQPRLFECYTCKNNGFPNEMVKLAGKTPEGNPIRLEPDGSSHTHKTKLAKRGYNPQQQQQIPMTQPLSGQQRTRDESIENMHKENQEGYAEYRKVMKDQVDATRAQVDATRALADAILELARAFKNADAVKYRRDPTEEEE